MTHSNAREKLQHRNADASLLCTCSICALREIQKWGVA